ncbi:MAG: prefoldin subunit beta [Thermoplasmata archaeon]
MAQEVPPELQNQMVQFQQIQQQLQIHAGQRVQYEAKLREIENTLEELENAKEDATIFKSIGTLLVEADDRGAIRRELEEHKETLNIRLKSLKKQEKSLTERYRELQKSIGEALRRSG